VRLTLALDRSGQRIGPEGGKWLENLAMSGDVRELRAEFAGEGHRLDRRSHEDPETFQQEAHGVDQVDARMRA